MRRGESKRGFNSFRKQVRDKAFTSKQAANCLSCKFFTSEEECSNPNVTEYDMVKEDNRTYCSFWSGYDYDNGRSKKKDWDW